jgi:glycosyltransferase involved in cell wall biosynthesis
MSDGPVRVLVCVPWRERLGGAEEMLWSILKHADDQRLQLGVAFLDPGPFEEEVGELGLTTFSVPSGRLRELWAGGAAIRRLSRIIRAEEPDLVLNWVSKAQLYGAAAAIAAGRHQSVLWWQHGVPRGHWMDRAATALPARAVGCSSRASAAAQTAAWPSRPTFVVHPGVETERVPPVDRSALGVPEGQPVLGIVGRLQPWKGQHRFIHGLRLLREGGYPAHGLVIGGSAHGFSPGYEQELKELIRELKLTDSITLVGQVADARPYIAAMDVLISASVNEPFGIVLAEGLAQGVPVVAVSDAGPREIVDQGVTGLLVPRPDAVLLAGAVAKLLDDEQRREEMAIAARRAAVDRFDVRGMTRAVEAKLGEIAGQGRAA